MNRVFCCYGGTFDWDKALKHLETLNTQAESPTLWDDQASAQKVLKERDALQTSITRIQNMQSQLKDNVELIELGEEEGDATIVEEAESQLQNLYKTSPRQTIYA